MTIVGHILDLLTLAFYAVAAWRLRPGGRRWRAVHDTLVVSQLNPGRLGRLAAWLVLWLLGIPILRDGFFAALAAYLADEGGT